jgi:hypothetical protein
MVSIRNPRKPLPPLAIETNYEAADFDHFEYFGAKLTGSKAILRLHLKNGTTIDLPSSDDALKHLLVLLIEAFGPHLVKLLKRGITFGSGTILFDAGGQLADHPRGFGFDRLGSGVPRFLRQAPALRRRGRNLDDKFALFLLGRLSGLQPTALFVPRFRRSLVHVNYLSHIRLHHITALTRAMLSFTPPLPRSR